MARQKGGLWLPLSVNFFDDERILEAGESAAMLYLAMCCKAKQLLSDGALAAFQIERLCVPGWRKRLAALIQHELVMEIEPGTYLITGWSKHNRLAVEVDRSREVDRRRKAMERTVKQTVFERDGHACRYCGATENLTLDHIKPIVLGGSIEDEANLQTLCKSCNSRKGKRDATGLTVEQARSWFGITLRDSHGTVTGIPRMSGGQSREEKRRGTSSDESCPHGAVDNLTCALCRRGAA